MSDGMALEKRRDVATTEEHLLNLGHRPHLGAGPCRRASCLVDKNSAVKS